VVIPKIITNAFVPQLNNIWIHLTVIIAKHVLLLLPIVILSLVPRLTASLTALVTYVMTDTSLLALHVFLVARL